MMNAIKKIVYLLIYIMTITPYFFTIWFVLLVGASKSASKMFVSVVLYGILLIPVIGVIFTDAWGKRRSLLIVRITTVACVINIILPSLLFFDGIIYTLEYIPTLLVLIVLDCIYYFMGKKMIDDK